MTWSILFCSVLASAVFLERLLYFHRISVRVGEFMRGLANLIRGRRYAEAQMEAAATSGPVQRVVHSAIIHHSSPRAELKEIVQEAGQLEVPRLERYLSVLHGIAHAAPLIGLLGTIIGLMDTFTKLNNVNGYATPQDVAHGVYTSLVTAALGLVVAIPSYLFYAFLAAKSRHIMNDLERAGIEIVNILEDNRDTSSPAAANAGAQIVDFRDAAADASRKRGRNA